MGLHRLNGSPVHDHGVRLSADVQPSRQNAINPRKNEPAQLGVQAFYYPSRYWFDIRAAHGWEGEAHCSAAVAHSYPALDQIAAEPVTDLIGMDCLLVRGRKIIGHNVKASVRDWRVSHPLIPNAAEPARRVRLGWNVTRDRAGPGGGIGEGMAASSVPYRVVITREDGHWLAEVPSLKGAHTFARSLPALDQAVREVVVLAADLPDEAIRGLALEPEHTLATPAWTVRPKRFASHVGRLTRSLPRLPPVLARLPLSWLHEVCRSAMSPPCSALAPRACLSGGRPTYR